MKSQVFSCSLVADAAEELGFNSSRDEATIVDRVAHEGYAFLSITLPSLDDLLCAGLETGRLPKLIGWKAKRYERIPLFLHELWRLVFDRDGTLLSEPDPRAVYWIRQISRAFKKVKEVCQPEYVDKAIRSFIKTDIEVGLLRPPTDLEFSRFVAHVLFGKDVGRAICAWNDPTFRNGPGAVADRLDANERWDFPTVSPQCLSVVGTDRFRPNWAETRDRPPLVEEIPARLTAVPKTAVKPRLISIEPSYNQYLQQSLKVQLYAGLATHFCTNILDQRPNQLLAKAGSIDRSLATIDLSDASDRVHNGLVKALFGFNQQFVDVIQNTRSRMIQFEDGRVLPLRKFASMGSALTFPIETMVFTTIVVSSIARAEHDMSRRNALAIFNSGRVRVYGDDIIVPSQYYPIVIKSLEEYGFKVNSSKSYCHGFFRESCGSDSFRGVDVTPKYVRRRFDDEHLSPEAFASTVELHNQLFLRNGDTRTTRFLRACLGQRGDRLTRFSWLRDPAEIGYGGLYLFDYEDSGDWHTNADLQILRRKSYYLSGVQPLTRASWSGKLLKSLTGPRSDSPDHLERGGRTVSARLKYGWCNWR